MIDQDSKQQEEYQGIEIVSYFSFSETPGWCAIASWSKPGQNYSLSAIAGPSLSQMQVISGLHKERGSAVTETKRIVDEVDGRNFSDALAYATILNDGVNEARDLGIIDEKAWMFIVGQYDPAHEARRTVQRRFIEPLQEEVVKAVVAASAQAAVEIGRLVADRRTVTAQDIVGFFSEALSSFVADSLKTNDPGPAITFRVLKAYRERKIGLETLKDILGFDLSLMGDE